MLNDSIISKTNDSSDSNPKWDWIPCLFDLKRETKNKIEYANLAPQASYYLENQVLTKEKAYFLKNCFFSLGSRDQNINKNGQRASFF